MEPMSGVEPLTYWLRISCSTNWATSAYIAILAAESPSRKISHPQKALIEQFKWSDPILMVYARSDGSVELLLSFLPFPIFMRSILGLNL